MRKEGSKDRIFREQIKALLKESLTFDLRDGDLENFRGGRTVIQGESSQTNVSLGVAFIPLKLVKRIHIRGRASKTYHEVHLALYQHQQPFRCNSPICSLIFQLPWIRIALRNRSIMLSFTNLYYRHYLLHSIPKACRLGSSVHNFRISKLQSALSWRTAILREVLLLLLKQFRLVN